LGLPCLILSSVRCFAPWIGRRRELKQWSILSSCGSVTKIWLHLVTIMMTES
jgi:hypothetical protein